MCVDYRRLNTKTRMDAFLLPRVNKIFDHLAGAKYFSTVDLKSAYNQVVSEAGTRTRDGASTRKCEGTENLPGYSGISPTLHSPFFAAGIAPV